MNIEAVIFDFDGTLANSEQITFNVVRPILSKYLNKEISDSDLNDLKGKVWKTTFKEWLPDTYLELYAEIDRAWTSMNPFIPMYPDVSEMLASLKERNTLMAIASSRESGLLKQILKQNNLTEYFSYIVGQEDTKSHKPSPDPLLAAAKGIGIRPAKCIYIGDQPWDLMASRAAGMMSGAALWGEAEAEAMLRQKPDMVFKIPHDVVDFVTVAHPDHKPLGTVTDDNSGFGADADYL